MHDDCESVHWESTLSTVHASKNTDSSVFYTEIETKILNTDSDPQNTDIETQLLEWSLYSKLEWLCDDEVKSRMQTCRSLQKYLL